MEEIFCPNCKKTFEIKNTNGAYITHVCPNCKRKHNICTGSGKRVSPGINADLILYLETENGDKFYIAKKP